MTLGLLLLNHCAGPSSEAGSSRVVPRRQPKVNPPAAGLPALVVAQVPSGTQGPVIAHFEDRSLAVHARTTDANWQFQSTLINRASGHVEAPVDLGPAPKDLELLFLKALPKGNSILAYTHLNDDGSHHLSLQLLDATGKRRVGPIDIAASGEALQWLDVVPCAAGPLVFWASRRGDRADVRAAALSPDGLLRASARDVLSDLRAWQVAPATTGAVLAAIRAVNDKAGGSLVVSFLDDTGVMSGKPMKLTESTTADLDLDVMSVGTNNVVAWTDHLNGDSRLHAAAVNDKTGIVTAAYPLTPPLGDQLLVKLVAPVAQGSAYIVWQNAQLPTSEPRLQLASISDKAQLGKQRSSVAFPGLSDRVPEVVGTRDGLALLTQIPASALARFAAPKPIGFTPEESESLQVPVFAALDGSLAITGVEPLLTASRPAVPSLVWGLDCRADKCLTLAALTRGTDVAVVGIPLSISDRAGRSLMTSGNDVGARTAADGFDANLRKWLVEDVRDSERSRLAAVRVVTSGPPLADLAVTRGGDVPLISTLSFADPEVAKPAGVSAATAGERGAPQVAAASIELRSPLGESNLLAGSSRLRALSDGGLAWANSADTQDRVLAFSAPGQQQPQLVVLRLDHGGKKLSQRPITHHSKNIASITAAGVKGGYFVGWIEEHAASSTAQFVRLSHSLDRKAPEQTLATAESIKTGLRLLPHGDEVWAIWSDTRESTAKRGDIFLARLKQSDGRAVSAEQRVFETPAHSHSPQLATCQSGVVAAFMESEPREAQPSGIASVRIARLDDNGRPIVMRQVSVSEGVPSGYGLDCGPDQCRIAVAVDLGGTGQIEVASFDPQKSTPIQTIPLIRSQGPADESVSPVIAGNDVYWVDRGTEKRVRVMRAAVNW